MENKLISYFTQEEIDYIYECLTEYSIRNYEKMPQGAKEELQEKYNHARNLSTQTIYLSDKELEDFLLKTQQKYQENIKVNQELIEINKLVPIITLQKYKPKDLTVEETIYYLLDFMTTYINYSESYFNHCVLTPPTNNIEFDFKNTVPVDHSINNILVQGQGTAEDICNTMKMLGAKFGIPINTTFVEYQNRLHAINTVEVGENQISLIDTTRMVREGKVLDEYCLVDQETLNKDDEYKFNYDDFNFSNLKPEFKEGRKETVTISKTKITTNYNMTNIIHEIRSYLPKTAFQQQNQKTI